MAIRWTSDLAIGVQQVDDQHKELFGRIDRLLVACNAGTGKKEVAAVLRFLEEYVVTHFDAEEAFMIVHAYPGYAAHKAQHGVFIDNLAAVSRQLEEEGPGLCIVLSTNSLVVRWLTDHIRKTDAAMGAFLKMRPTLA